MTNLTAGNFTSLAKNYSKYRPHYSESCLNSLLSLVEKPISKIDIADVGAGTGIWTRMLYSRKPNSLVAVEPNDEMRSFGEHDCVGTSIKWLNGSGEKTDLNDSSYDLLTMASSFHWVDFDQGLKEFHRVLRSGGRFAALWNPRFIKENPLLLEIEEKIHSYRPNLKRVSSGLSGITNDLTEKLRASPYFEDVIYMEGYHTREQTPEEYIGVWNSVNDIRVQLGEINFKKFLDYVESRVSSLESIKTTYRTRLWTAKKIG